MNLLEEKFQPLISKYKIPFFYLILGVLVYFPLFQHLDNLPIRLWDESRLATNAYEMFKDGDLIVTHFEGKPDMWNTKPPLLIWCQAGLMKLIGVNELAVRLPSAFAALGTCALLLFFSIYYFKSHLYGFFAVVVLISTNGYIDIHCTRTGDYDAMLIFFTTMYCISYFLYLEKNSTKFLYVFFISFSLAVMTKGIAGFLLLPGLLVYTVIQKKFLSTLKNIHFYIGSLLFLTIAVGYYFLRESQNEGYINQVWINELGGRYLEVMENHSASWLYYIKLIIKQQYSHWVVFAISGVVIGIIYSKEKYFKFTLFISLILFFYFLAISVSQTKLLWYDTLGFPFLAFLVANVLIYMVYNLLNVSKLSIRKPYPCIVVFLIILATLLPAYGNIFAKTFKPTEDTQILGVKNFYSMSNFMRGLQRGENKLSNFILVTYGYNPHILFYYNPLAENDNTIKHKWHGDLVAGDRVLSGDPYIIDFIEKNFKYSILEGKENIKFYLLIQRLK